MPINGMGYADKAQEEIERLLRKIYQDAQQELIQKLDQHTKRLYKLDKIKRKQLEDGQITQTQYGNWVRSQLFTGQQWKNKVNSLSETMLHANEQANAIIEGKRMAVFGANYLYQAKKLSQNKHIGVSFDLYDSATVTRLLKKRPDLLPKRKQDRDKDFAWNRENIANAVTQGIIQGDSILALSQRIAKNTALHNRKATERYARTAMTGAQNAGRMEMLHEAQAMGIGVKKVWLATMDSRTRDAHAKLDGQEADVDEPFKSELGDIMFPGDPTADPANVWNCRCTLIYKYDKYPMQNSTRYDQKSGAILTALNMAALELSKGGNISDLTIDAISEGEVNLEELLAKEIECAIEEAEERVEIIQAFTGSEYVRMRQYQQKHLINQEDIDYFVPREKKLEDFIARGAKWKGGTTYRTIGLTDKELSDMLTSVEKGKTIPMRGTSSWSSSKNVALDHSIPKENRVVFLCGTQNHGTSIMPYSISPYEYEVLVSKVSRYKPIRYFQENGITYIVLEEL